MSDDVKVLSCTLSELLNLNVTELKGIKGQLTIPEYQRPYVWNEKQINKLLNDFKEYQACTNNEKPMYYLGSIILHQDENTNELNIIDGQQRITTALILAQIKGLDIKNGIKYTSPKSIQNIKRNYHHFKSLKDELFALNFDEINVTVVITKTKDLAYTFFETQNTGGVRLSGSDIVKAHHLRAVDNEESLKNQTKEWEKYDCNKIEDIIQKLTKIRFWNYLNWRNFPSYYEQEKIKQHIIEEFSEKTKSDGKDISHHYYFIERDGDNLLQVKESPYKKLRQPLSAGNNTLDFITDYVEVHKILFEENDHRIGDDFYEFREKLYTNNYETIYLKELFEMALICYVCRFGFKKILEASLWLFRKIYSLRLSKSRNVTEAGCYSFVWDEMLIDKILAAYTMEELFDHLKNFEYVVSEDNLESHKSKGRYILLLKNYFGPNLPLVDENTNLFVAEFDKKLVECINKKLGSKNG